MNRDLAKRIIKAARREARAWRAMQRDHNFELPRDPKWAAGADIAMAQEYVDAAVELAAHIDEARKQKPREAEPG